MRANASDVRDAANRTDLKYATRQRLSIKKGKLETLAAGIKAIADMEVRSSVKSVYMSPETLRSYLFFLFFYL